ncbi:MAG: preprotein translocase subunit SecG [Cyclobacteriaceae bacterium]|jgi:preprotein translocase subunit SecG
MYVLIIGIIILVAALLVLVVLAQNPKGGGLTSQFGGSGSSQIMGVKKTNDLLEKLTWGFAIALLMLTLSTNFFLEVENDSEFISPNIENAQQQNTLPPSISPTGSGIDDLGLEGDSITE